MQNKGFTLDKKGFLGLWAEFFANTLSIWDEELNTVDPSAGEMPVLLWSSELTKANIQQYLSKER